MSVLCSLQYEAWTIKLVKVGIRCGVYIKHNVRDFVKERCQASDYLPHASKWRQKCSDAVFVRVRTLRCEDRRQEARSNRRS